MTPPYNITLYEADNTPDDDALRLLCKRLAEENVRVPGVTSANGLAARFCAAYAEWVDASYEVRKHLRIYTLRAVSGDVPLVGHFRLAAERDRFFFHTGAKASTRIAA